MAADLSIIIPARNEQFLARTIEDIMEKKRGKTEVIAICDGYWPDPVIPDYRNVHVIHYTESIGQRAATNKGVLLSNAKFIMKCDAHCCFDEGFDIKLMQDCEYDWTVVPTMYNLHVFDWKCKKCGNQTYQGPIPKKCEKCKAEGKPENFEMVMIWQPRWSRKSNFMRFDNNLRFQYWGSYNDRKESKTDIADLMCCIGAAWFMHRDRYWDIDGMDETHGSWGQMGVELACKTWLSGGRMVVNKKTWFSHLFRTQPGFGFPYPNPGVERARQISRELWLNNKWPKAKYPLSWLIKKFWPIPDWDKIPDDSFTQVPLNESVIQNDHQLSEDIEEQTPVVSTPVSHLKKGIVYYTDNRANERIRDIVIKQLLYSTNGYEIVSASLSKIDFGKNVVLPLKRGILTMFKQILAGLETCQADVVFLVEHDVLYHPSHFDFIPGRNDVYYYNEHTYKVDFFTGQAVFYFTKQTSGLCAYRNLLVEHYKKRIEKIEQNARDLAAQGLPIKNDGFSRHMGFEPGCHSIPRGVDNYSAEKWMSPFPNIDIRHDKNLTPNRWDKSLFRDPNACLGWRTVDEVPGWGVTKNRFNEFLKDIEVRLCLPK